MKKQTSDNNKPTDPTKGATTETQPVSEKPDTGKPDQPEAASTVEKDIPELTQKTAQKKPDAKATKKPRRAAVKKEGADKAEERKDSKAGLVIAILALLLAIGVGAVVYILYQQGQQQSAVLANRVNELQSGIDANQQQLTRLDTLQQDIGALRSDVGSAASVRQRIEAEQQALNTALAEMSARLGRTTVAWRLAEIEYLLIVANTRLSLERDRSSALVALQTADQKLRAIGDPAFVPVRQSIANEITGLKAAQEPDITGMALTLGSLAEAVENLPLLDTRPAPSPGPVAEDRQEDYRSLDWADIPRAVWDDIRGLVVVRRVDKPVEPLLPPAEEWYLRQNLQLKLEQARLSLLRLETTLFQHQLDEAASWLSAYFDVDSAAVKSLLESLQKLKQMELRPSLPDISESLRVLRQGMRQLGAEVEAAQREDGEQ